MADGPRIAIVPTDEASVAAAETGGAVVVAPAEAEGLVWTSPGYGSAPSAADLVALLKANPAIRWVQLPWAGVEPFAAAGVFDEEHVWTCGKGVYGRPVAEHALALALAGLHHLKPYSEARSWTGQAGLNLVDGQVTIFGGGGITEELVGLLASFHCQITVVRKQAKPLAGAHQVVGWEQRDTVLTGANVVFLALALTPETTGFFGRRQFEAMEDHAWLVNVARGRHVVTEELVGALRANQIGGAALDVTDPEPLPDNHPLWALPNCLITPHTANTEEMAIPLLSARITSNVRRWAAGEPLLGLVDPKLGY
jgi:phosphoglycerate dehydrogenase-like enzyme